MIASELIDSRETDDTPGLMVKMDLSKAFDNVSWSFLDYTFTRFGFGNVRKNWIRWCISNTRFSMVVNETASNLLRSSKGIKQGDPLSSFLFILVG